MTLKQLAPALFTAMALSACAHMPSDKDKMALRTLQHDVKTIEAGIYSNHGGDGGGLYDSLKYCSLQVHDRVNPEEIFDWPEKVDRHTDRDFFADANKDISEADFKLLIEKYKIYKQAALAKRENFEHRVKSCQVELRALVRREKVRTEQEHALVENLQNVRLGGVAGAPSVAGAPLASPLAAPAASPENVRDPAAALPEAVSKPNAASDATSAADDENEE